MVTRAFSTEDGNLGVSTLIGTRTRLYKDIDLTIDQKEEVEKHDNKKISLEPI